ncbi:MAG: DNA cytosine methyltransferase [Alphaproteobacteria bacterium]|nr:DNA cytosine methyltransferase [Alphaproteobacteria bacterium]
MAAYYNEYDPKTAAWLRQLIKNGDIAEGEVDERSITDVTAADLKGFSQHHFFAGIGTWSYALRRAGWADDRHVCTASLPCQPFSAAGRNLGKEDERHLLPHFLDLVRECRFNTIIGEQVPGAIKHGWLDDLYNEMERENYAVGSTVLTAAGAGKPHIRQRLYWVAESRLPNTISKRHEGRVSGGANSGWEIVDGCAGRSSTDSRMGNAKHEQHERRVHGCGKELAADSSGATSKFTGSSEISRMGNADGDGCKTWSETTEAARHGCAINTTSGIDWLYCADGKYRPIKSGIKPLVDGVARGVVYRRDAVDPNNSGINRATRIKGYGNAIEAETATRFIKAYMSIRG